MAGRPPVGVLVGGADPVGLLVVLVVILRLVPGEQAVEPPAGLAEDLHGLAALPLAPGREPLPDRAHHLADLRLEVAEVAAAVAAALGLLERCPDGGELVRVL